MRRRAAIAVCGLVAAIVLLAVALVDDEDLAVLRMMQVGILDRLSLGLDAPGPPGDEAVQASAPSRDDD